MRVKQSGIENILPIGQDELDNNYRRISVLSSIITLFNGNEYVEATKISNHYSEMYDSGKSFYQGASITYLQLVEDARVLENLGYLENRPSGKYIKCKPTQKAIDFCAKNNELINKGVAAIKSLDDVLE